MKKIFGFIFSLGLMGAINAQDLDKTKALKLIKDNSILLNINTTGDNAPKITNAYTDADRGLSYIYVQQNYKDIKLFNVIKTTVFKQDVLQSQEGDFVANIANKTNSATPTVSAFEAVKFAAKHLGLPNINNLVEVENTYNFNKQITFSKAGIAKQNIKVELVWRSNDDDKTFHLAWNVSIDVLHSSDYWNVRVDAATGNIIDKNNYTVYEKKLTPAMKKNQLLKKNIEEKNIAIKSHHRIKDDGVMTPSVTSASYNVIAYPKESRLSGNMSIETNPWLKAGATNNATTYGWHYDGTTDYDYTCGNNVYAYDDSLNQNAPGRFDTSTTPIPLLTFNRTPNFTKQPTTTVNRLFATDNLFYWNNIMHDVSYQYGFTEAAGNYQDDNMNRGGQGNDHVNAEAQDGGGTDNADFVAPPDGQNGTMEMFLFSGNPKIDGSLDNGVVSHEFTHGISIRLTGGASNSSCLDNNEQGGEGWSDYVALMMTTNWLTAKKTDGTKKRPLGNYASHLGVNGSGIRTYPYSTDMSINPHTYDNVANQTYSGEVHYIGEIWCSVLWDMTWNIIQQTDSINRNLYDASGYGGNSIALNLVMQGLKFQKCSPGFLDARNAIIKADSVLYGGIYHCSIWKAFAGRGMGYFALQGSSNNTNDQTSNYDMPPAFPKVPIITVSATNVTVGQTGITYTCSSVFGATGYQWTYTGTGVTFITGNGTKSVTVSFSSTATSGDMQVVAVNTSDCTSSIASVAVTVNPLPVVLSSFTVDKLSNTSLIQWTTATEINSKNFEVQRSIDGSRFNTIGIIAARGNSTTTNNYVFIDEKPFAGVNYYRLKQIDANGKFTVSNIKSVNFNADIKFDISLYPNPAKDVVTVECKDMREINLIDNLGRIVYKTKVNNASTTINLKQIPKGIYIVQVITIKDEIKTEKLIVE